MNPQTISDVVFAFPARISHLLPKEDEPGYGEYRDNCYTGNSWGFRLFRDWFYYGLTKLEMKPKEGVNSDLALRHIQTIMRSFEPQHEDKTASCAFLLEHWFEGATWERNPSSDAHAKRE